MSNSQLKQDTYFARSSLLLHTVSEKMELHHCHQLHKEETGCLGAGPLHNWKKMTTFDKEGHSMTSQKQCLHIKPKQCLWLEEEVNAHHWIVEVRRGASVCTIRWRCKILTAYLSPQLPPAKTWKSKSIILHREVPKKETLADKGCTQLSYSQTCNWVLSNMIPKSQQMCLTGKECY